MTEKWIVDDAGTLINMSTRNHYDYMEEVVDVLNKLSEENEQLKQEKEELLDKILECQKALSRKRTKEEPHWHKYGNNEGYTKKTDLDIRFCGDLE